MIGWSELIVFIAVLVLLFGATQIPKIARSLGEGLKEFRKSVREAKKMEEEEKAETGKEE